MAFKYDTTFDVQVQSSNETYRLTDPNQYSLKKSFQVWVRAAFFSSPV